jgi:hypothetical protein
MFSTATHGIGVPICGDEQDFGQGNPLPRWLTRRVLLQTGYHSEGSAAMGNLLGGRGIVLRPNFLFVTKMLLFLGIFCAACARDVT